MTTHYKYENGIFTEDKENYKKLGKRAFLIYTGGVWILKDCYFDKQKKRYCGEHNNALVELRPSEILDIQCIA